MGVLFLKTSRLFAGKNENVQVGFLHRVFSPGRVSQGTMETEGTHRDAYIIFIGSLGGNCGLRHHEASKLLLCQVPEAFAQARGDLIQFLQFPAMSAHILTQASTQSNKKYLQNILIEDAIIKDSQHTRKIVSAMDSKLLNHLEPTDFHRFSNHMAVQYLQ